jgi:hypothetical protein
LAEVSTLLGVGNVAEIEFYRNGIRVTGADYGTRGSWNNNGKTSQKALDGDVHTRFEGPSPNRSFAVWDGFVIFLEIFRVVYRESLLAQAL